MYNECVSRHEHDSVCVFFRRGAGGRSLVLACANRTADVQEHRRTWALPNYMRTGGCGSQSAQHPATMRARRWRRTTPRSTPACHSLYRAVRSGPTSSKLLSIRRSTNLAHGAKVDPVSIEAGPDVDQTRHRFGRTGAAARYLPWDVHPTRRAEASCTICANATISHTAS